MPLERIVAGLTERLEHRYYGKYRATVVDNKDPAKLGRLRLRVDSVFGPGVVTGWASPCAPYGGAAGQGFLFVPDRDAGVWAEFEQGDPQFPIWVGTYWTAPDATSQLPKPLAADGSEDDVQDPPTRKIIRTGKGHTIQFEDADGSEVLVIREGSQGHQIRLSKDGVQITDATGNSVELTPSAMTLHAAVPFTIDAPGQSVTVVAASIDLKKG